MNYFYDHFENRKLFFHHLSIRGENPSDKNFQLSQMGFPSHGRLGTAMDF